MTERFVYFIRPVGMQGPVKIGCTKHRQNRLRELTIWSPEPLEIVAFMAGDMALEQRFHAMFESSHKHHEWFNWTPEMEAVIESVAAGRFDISTLPAPLNITAKTVKRTFTPEQRKQTSYWMRLRSVERKSGYAAPVMRTTSWSMATDADYVLLDKFFAEPHVYGEAKDYPRFVAARELYHARLGSIAA